MRNQFLAKRGNSCNFCRIPARNSNSMNTRLTIETVQPGFGHNRIGEIAFVQDFQTGTLPMETQFLNHGIAAGRRKAGIQNLDNQIGCFHRFRGPFSGRIHVPREPLNCHILPSVHSCQCFYMRHNAARKGFQVIATFGKTDYTSL